MDPDQPEDSLNQVIRNHSEWLSNQLHVQRENLFPPDASKQMRTFTSGEAAGLLGINDSYLRKLHLDGKGPNPDGTGPADWHYRAISDTASSFLTIIRVSK